MCAVQAGAEHSAAVTEDGCVFMWGRGDSGQLGLGDDLSRCLPTLLPGYVAVHPDKTLRRSKRNMPLVRPVAGGELAEWDGSAEEEQRPPVM